MKDVDYLVSAYRRIPPMVAMHLADLSDAEMLVRPAENANHAAWQLAHMVSSTTNLVTMNTPGAVPPIPEQFAKHYGKEGAKLDAGFESKEQMLERLAVVMTAAATWLSKLSDADKEKPTPERIHRLAKTIGELTVVIPTHISMHIGQMQVIRRKLGKPVLF